MIVAGIAMLGTLANGFFQYEAAERASNIHLVEVGIGILRAPVSEDISGIRGWAMNLIEENSGKKFDAAQRAVLLKNSRPFIAVAEAALPRWLPDNSYIIQHWPADLDKVPCSAWKKNPDRSISQMVRIVIGGANRVDYVWE